MDKEELTINKDNYKGYVELYCFQRFTLYGEQLKNIKELNKKL